MVNVSMVLKLLIFTLMAFSGLAHAVHNPAYYGQKDFDEFYGSRDLYYSVDPYHGNVQFEENSIFKSYFDYLISSELKEHGDFFQGPFQSSLSCPHWEMDKMYEHLRFANRVIALSYIYESIRLQKITGKKLGDNKVCSIDWNKILKQCKPVSKDMNLFVKSASHIIKNERESFIDVSHSIKKYQSQWQENYNKNKFTDISHYRVKLYCQEEYCNKRIDSKTAIKIMNKSCESDTQKFIRICSEIDQLYGMSEIQEAYALLVNSDILTMYNSEGHAAGCLRRFKQQTRSKEVKNNLLKTIFPIVYEHMLKDQERFLQGSIFFAGTLKQFVDKGLDTIYRTEPVKKVVKKVEKKVVVKSVKKEDKVEFIDRREKKKKKKKKKIVVKKKPKKKAPKKSSFLLAVEMQQQLDMERVKVDMLRFKYDFLFSIPLKKLLDKNLEVYTTRKGLEQMKKYDNLGSPSGPMPLMFLKYLIETDKHQSLYNILIVVGEQFYVNNDIDKLANTQFDYIELRNDETTNNRWQINVLKVPEEYEEETPPLIQN